MQEIWKPVVGYEGIYEVSNLGRIKSIPRNGTANFERILKPSKSNVGYFHLSFSKNNTIQTKNIHVVSKKGIVVDHIDNNKTNNKLDNLRILSHRENIIRGNRSNTKNNNIYKVKDKYRVIVLSKHIGYYNTIEDAINSRDNALKNI